MHACTAVDLPCWARHDSEMHRCAYNVVHHGYAGSEELDGPAQVNERHSAQRQLCCSFEHKLHCVDLTYCKHDDFNLKLDNYKHQPRELHVQVLT
jgi:hypothetical protein